MGRWLKIFLAVVFIWAAAMPVASAHFPSDPNFMGPDISKDWKTLETSHFRIHHEASNKEFARQMGAVAERVHEKLTPWLNWQPQDRTEVVILDSVDFSNGGATPLPYNRFYIYMPTPVDGEIMDNNPWLELVFTHEYVHILHLDMAFAAPDFFRKIFGRLSPAENLLGFMTFPQIFAPSWVAEGLAVYGESDNEAGYGRLNNAAFEAMMRMEVQRGLRSLTEESFEGYSGSRWPYGQIYLYGAYFFKFVDERYGRDKVVDYIRIYGRNVIPWRMDARAKQIFGKPAKVVWKEFQDYLKRRFEPQLAAIKQRGETVTRTVYDRSYVNRALTAAGNGDLYFYHDDSASHPEVRRIRADGVNESVLEEDDVLELDWQDASGLLLSKLAVCDNTNLYADLYRWKPGMSSPERLTHCGRYPRAAQRPDGKAIAAVQLERDVSRLVLLDAEGNNPKTLAELPSGDALGYIAWSPDNATLVASVKRRQTGWNIELFDVNAQSWQQVTLNSDRQLHPHFSADGKEIYFLSDHGNAWNLRRIKLGDDNVETVSNIISGLEEAVMMPDKTYRMVEYTASGLAITALDQPIKVGVTYSAQAAKPPVVAALASAADIQAVPYEGVADYSALSTLKPRSWFPTLVSNTDGTSYVGAAISGADVLGFHQWSALPLYYTSQKALGGMAAYSFYNQLTLSAQRQFLVYGDVNTPFLHHDEETRYQALLNHSFNSLDSSFELAGGIASEKVKARTNVWSGIYQEYKDMLAGAIAKYDSTEFYRRSISLEDGRRIELSDESYDVLHRSDHTGKTYRLDWNEYISLGASHVLKLRLQRAHGDPGIRPYVLGGATETFSTIGQTTGLGRRNFPLRGYPSGLTSLIGTHYGLGTVEWRIPLGLYYDGFFVPPLGLGRQSLSLFADRGDAWNDGEKIQFKNGAGVEWNAETLIGYDVMQLGITLGYAHGFNQGGVDRLYLRLGFPIY